MRTPDGLRSRAVLIGTCRYTVPGLHDLPAVRNNIHELKRILTRRDGAGIRDGDCVEVLDATDLGTVWSRLERAADDAEDLLLVYYAGHGVLDRNNNLYLGLSDTTRKAAHYTGIDIAKLREVIGESRADTRVLLLDCCFSGRASEAMGAADTAALAMGQVEIEGTYTLTATSANVPARAPIGEEHTTFTGALLKTLKEGIPQGPELLTLDAIYHNLLRQLRAQNAPLPERKGSNNAGDLALARNPAFGKAEPPPEDREDRPRKINYFDLDRYQPTTVSVDDELFCVDFSPNRQLIAAGSEKAAMIWHLPVTQGDDPAHALPHPRFVYSVAFTSDAKTLVTGCEDGGVRFWDPYTGDKVGENLQAHRGAVYAIAISRDGDYLATGDSEGFVQVWNIPGNTYSTDYEFHSSVSSLAFSPDKSIIAVGKHDNEILLWDHISNQKSRLGAHDSSVESVAFTPDGRGLASCGLDKKVRLWNVDPNNPAWDQPDRQHPVEHKYLVKSVAFSPNGKVIVSAGWDKRLWLWDVAGKRRQKIPMRPNDEHFKWHTDWIWAASFSPDGGMLASAGSDGRLILWTIG